MRLRLRSLLAVYALLTLTASLALAQDNDHRYNHNYNNGNVFTCSSNNGMLQSCRVNSNAPIQFVGQRSSSPCIAGQTYGINQGGVWVTNGCSADFAIGNNGQYPQGAYNNDYDYPQNGDNNGYYNQGRQGDHDRDHHHPRRYNNNGYYANGNNGYSNNGYPYNQQGAYPGPYGAYMGSGQNIQYYGKYNNGVTTCSARSDLPQTYCSTYGALSNAVVLSQNGRCVEGQTWGINSDGLWVSGGCSGKFQIQR